MAWIKSTLRFLACVTVLTLVGCGGTPAGPEDNMNGDDTDMMDDNGNTNDDDSGMGNNGGSTEEDVSGSATAAASLTDNVYLMVIESLDEGGERTGLSAGNGSARFPLVSQSSASVRMLLASTGGPLVAPVELPVGFPPQAVVVPPVEVVVVPPTEAAPTEAAVVPPMEAAVVPPTEAVVLAPVVVPLGCPA